MTDQIKTPIVSAGRRRLLLAAPAIGFTGVAGMFAIGLNRDPILLPSVLIGKKMPDFDLPPVKGTTLGLSRNSLLGEVSLVNVFASWCVPCREEHPVFMRLSSIKLAEL